MIGIITKLDIDEPVQINDPLSEYFSWRGVVKFKRTVETPNGLYVMYGLMFVAPNNQLINPYALWFEERQIARLLPMHTDNGNEPKSPLEP